MKKNEISVGGHYIAKVGANVTTVRVDAIREVPGRTSGSSYWQKTSPATTCYDVTNLRTGRKTTFRSAMKFRGTAKQIIVNGKPQYDIPREPAMVIELPEGDPRVKAEDVYATLSTEPISPVVLGQNLQRTKTDAAVVAEMADDMLKGRWKNENTAELEASVARGEGLSRLPTLPNGTPIAKPTFGIAGQLASAPVDDAPHLIVEARAGTGKTTTLVEGLKAVMGGTSGMTPSPQQAAVWAEMARSAGVAKTVAFVAFNKSIAAELQSRVPAGVQASTMHSMGFRAVNDAFRGRRLEVTKWRVTDIICRLLNRESRDLRKSDFLLLKSTEELVSLCKMNLVGGTSDELDGLTSHYDVDLDKYRAQVYELVPRVLEECRNVLADGRVDFDDMVYLPVALDLPMTKFDLLLVDEAQDLNRCQQALAKKAGKRLVLCGDRRQAIYGFAGADDRSLTRMAEELGATSRGCKTLPLTVTRRCGHAIVAEARELVPDFEAFPTNPAGKIDTAQYPAKDRDPSRDYHHQVRDGDMLLCRMNAPLVSQCFAFLKMGKKANIQGRDVGAGLITTVKKMAATSVPDLVGKLSDWLHAETAKEQAKRNPCESRIVALQDRVDCLTCFTEDMATVDAVIARIESIFTDDKRSPGVKLSSIHRAKGLEARRVFILEPKHARMREDRMQEWERDQELNLRYVAVTRAIEELYYVR